MVKVTAHSVNIKSINLPDEICSKYASFQFQERGKMWWDANYAACCIT